MLERTIKTTSALLLACALFSGCSSFTKAGRQQAAYARYIKKYSHNRAKQQVKFKKMKVPKGTTSPATVTAGVNDGPQSVSANN